MSSLCSNWDRMALANHFGRPEELWAAGAGGVGWREDAAAAAPDVYGANVMASSGKSSATSQRPRVMAVSECVCVSRISQRWSVFRNSADATVRCARQSAITLL